MLSLSICQNNKLLLDNISLLWYTIFRNKENHSKERNLNYEDDRQQDWYSLYGQSG